MSEISEIYADHRAIGQEKRAKNRKSSTELLSENGIDFVVKNDGAHIIISIHGKPEIDFWPGTGLWIDRKEKSRKRRGVMKLIAYCRSKNTI